MNMIPMGMIPAHHASRKTAALAVAHGEEILSWRDLAENAARRANSLRRIGVMKDELVTVALPNGNAMIETVFAIWMAGGIPHPVSPKMPLGELKRVLDLGKPRAVIGFDPALLPGWQTLPAQWCGEGAPQEATQADPATCWKAIGSGGSTGNPKLIFTHRAAIANPEVYDVFDPAVHNGRLGRPDGVVVNPGPLYHNGPFNLMFNNLLVGSTLAGLRRFDAEEVLRTVERHRGELLYMVPTMMQRIWNLPEDVRDSYDLSSLRGVLHMAAACPGWLKRRWIEWLGPERIFEVYGSTEALGATLMNAQEWLDHPTAVGRFQGYMANSKVRVLDENRHDVAPGEIGELFFLPPGGRGSTYHYVGAEPNVDGEYESVGDLGRIDDEGYLHLADRRTDLILRGGANIYPAEVEAAIEEHPDVAVAIVIGLPHHDLGQIVHAIVELWPSAANQLDELALTVFVRERLTTYKLPASWEFVTTPLRDEAGKARRSALREARVAVLQGAGT